MAASAGAAAGAAATAAAGTAAAEESEIGGPAVLVDREEAMAAAEGAPESSQAIVSAPAEAASADVGTPGGVHGTSAPGSKAVATSIRGPSEGPETMDLADGGGSLNDVKGQGKKVAEPSVDAAASAAEPGGGGEEQVGELVETDIDEMVSAVSVKAVELGKNVAVLASSAGQEAAAVVHNLSETVSGFGTNFVSLFSVFDAGTGAVAAPTALAPLLGSRAPPEATTSSGKGQTVKRAGSHAIDVQANFGLPPEESLMEAFECRLVQTYSCAHNSFTPDIPKAFGGTLYLTENHVCFLVDDSGRRIPIKLRAEDIEGVSRELPRVTTAAKGEQLRIALKPREPKPASPSARDETDTLTGTPSEKKADLLMILGGFVSTEELESALALLEHLSGAE